MYEAMHSTAAQRTTAQQYSTAAKQHIQALSGLTAAHNALHPSALHS